MFFPTVVVLRIMMSLHAHKYVLVRLVRESEVMIPSPSAQTVGSGRGDFLLLFMRKEE